MNIIKQKGSATVEFAMMVPILLILVFMVSALGITFYRLNAVTKSVQVASRYLSDVSPNQTITTSFPIDIKKLICYGNIGGTGVAILPDCNTKLTVKLTVTSTHITVSATYNSSLILGGILDGLMGLIGGSTATQFMTLRASSVMRFT
ncbi:MAG: hypothetical protein RLZ75_3069 [Pseudomonadota bacterium]|jgi:Flp pilus assembly protein TadG